MKFKAGDSILWRANAPLIIGLGYTHAKWYSGTVVEHADGYKTIVKILDDNGEEKITSTYYNDFEAGMTEVKFANEEDQHARILESKEEYKNKLKKKIKKLKKKLAKLGEDSE